jgi:hypothetical protein
LGWVERGICKGKAVFRKKAVLDTNSNSAAQESGVLFVQPDGEIFVTPEAGLKQRWVLEEISERETADNLFVYRLTRDACVKAYNAGYTLFSVTTFLERGFGSALPDQVVRALQDWFAPLGKVTFAEVMLLRTDNAEVAALLKKDPVIAGKLLEQVGDRDFIIDTASFKLLRDKLVMIGFPPMERNRNAPDNHSAERHRPSNAMVEDNNDEKEGWIYRRYDLSAYEADRTLPGKDELFPGMMDIPATWISRPRNYHVSTRKELIQRAINWQVSVQIGQGGNTQIFVPKGFEEAGTNWRVFGRWRGRSHIGSQKYDSTTVAVNAEDIAEIMILLPPYEELEYI